MTRRILFKVRTIRGHMPPSSPFSKSHPSREILDLYDQLEVTARDVIQYMEKIQAQPDDFAHKHWEELDASLQKASRCLTQYVFKKEQPPINFDRTLVDLDKALKYLIKKRDEETSKAKKDDSHQEKANELVAAVGAIQYLVAMIGDFQQKTTPSSEEG